MALGAHPGTECIWIRETRWILTDDQITIDQLVLAVSNALEGCR
jgi:hypothetical protein